LRGTDLRRRFSVQGSWDPTHCWTVLGSGLEMFWETGGEMFWGLGMFKEVSFVPEGVIASTGSVVGTVSTGFAERR
jgi:hypothetical protein